MTRRQLATSTLIVLATVLAFVLAAIGVDWLLASVTP